MRRQNLDVDGRVSPAGVIELQAAARRPLKLVSSGPWADF